LRRVAFAASLVLAGVVSGCHHSSADGYEILAGLGPGWEVRRNDNGPLPSVTAVRRGAADQAVWVYVEGDGKAWQSRTRLSDDPTPENPVALKLASTPQDATVIYLGRPCQFVMRDGASCPSKWWSTARYADEITNTLNRVLDQLLPAARSGLVLVGYSGGGNVATLMAAQRNDVTGLVTIAANLDTDAWTALHRVTPLAESVNPASRAADLAHVPQVHFQGGKDSVVPASVTEAFTGRFAQKTNIHILREASFDHHCCWAADWVRLRQAAKQALQQ
jgi:hypothetical protein